MSDQPDKCPFCGAKWIKGTRQYVCGTVPAENGLYTTGLWCDKECFRNGYMRCLRMLRSVRDHGWAPEFVSKAIEAELRDQDELSEDE